MARPWRRKSKRTGKFIGAYHFTPPGRSPVNLETQDAAVANERARAVMRGEWPPARPAAEPELEAAERIDAPSPAAAAAAAFDPARALPAVAPEPPPVPTPPVPDTHAQPAATGGPSATQTPPAQPDEVIPPPVDWTAAASSAAGGSAPPPPSPEEAAAAAGVDFSEMYETLGMYAVEAQLVAQAWVGERFVFKGKVAGPIEPDNQLRAAAAKMWAAQLRIWMPTDVALPPYQQAIGMTAILFFGQMAGAKPKPKQEERPPENSSSSSANEDSTPTGFKPIVVVG